jgi:hypothetical protein
MQPPTLNAKNETGLTAQSRNTESGKNQKKTRDSGREKWTGFEEKLGGINEPADFTFDWAGR